MYIELVYDYITLMCVQVAELYDFATSGKLKSYLFE